MATWVYIVVVVFLLFLLFYMKSSPTQKGAWTVYGSEKCSWTRKQLDTMKTKGIDYTFVDCDSQKCDGITGFPTLKGDDGTVKVGYTPM
jgi:hypothetical protein